MSHTKEAANAKALKCRHECFTFMEPRNNVYAWSEVNRGETENVEFEFYCN